MRNEILCILGFLIVSSISSGTVLAQPPLIPANYSGSVIVNDVAAPDGTAVFATIEDYTSNSVTVSGGSYKNLVVAPPDATYVGKTIEFWVDVPGDWLPVKAAETDVFGLGTSHDLFNLTVTIPPVVTLPAYSPDPTSDSTPTYSGTATDATTNVVDIEYRVDGGAWTDVDAFIQSLTVSFTFTTPALADGARLIEVRAKDEAGNWSTIVSDMLTVDTTPPVISDVSATNITTSSANIIWVTDEPSTSQVEYGRTTAYGLLSTLDPALVTSHSVTLTGLSAGTTYHFRVISADGLGNPALSSDFTFTTATPPPPTPTPSQFELSNLSISPAVVEIGETVTVIVNVANVGELEGTYQVTLKVNDVPEASKSVTLGGGAATTVSFAVTKDVAGTYDVAVDGLTGSFTVVAPPPLPAAFTVSSLTINPSEVTVGEEVIISVTVQNTGDLEGTYAVTLKINGNIEDTESVTLAGGATKSVTFRVAEGTEGTYNVAVDGLTGTFVVTEPAPSPGSTPPPTTGPVIGLWMTGGIIAAAVIISVTLFYVRRRR